MSGAHQKATLGSIRHDGKSALRWDEPSDVTIDKAFVVMASFPTLEQAAGHLIEQHNIKTSPQVLALWAEKFPERYENARAQAAQLREQTLAGNLLDAADLAVKVEIMAIEQVRADLEAGKIKDPSRVARELADVAAKSVDKKLSLEGRPSRVTVTRSVTEIFNQLEALKVIEGSAEEDGAGA